MIAPLTSGLLPATGAAAASRAAGSDGEKSEVEQAAAKFEGVFMSMLVEEMFKGTDMAGGQPIYAGMITKHLGEALADAGGMGLAAMITRQLDGAGHTAETGPERA